MGLYHSAAGINQLEQLARGNSPVHRLHPAAKILTTLVYMATVISFPSRDVSALVPLFFYPAVLMSLSGTSWRPLLVRLYAALPFSLVGGISNLFILRETAFYLGNFPVSFGLLSFISIMLKTALTVFAVLLLIATTSFVDISRQLTVMGMPKILSLQLLMTYRYISTLIHEAASMFTAYILRAPCQKGIKMKDMGSFLGQLLLRSFDKAERVYQAMKCRGFEGVYQAAAVHPLRPSDWVYTIIVSGGMITLRFFNLSLFFGGLAGRLK
ncbi:MAG: cobalt ECF transporter T component CbiQ [Treponema sp.]|nr:cobalt ECF transporter T component CbiQ [Treponema sp.]